MKYNVLILGASYGSLFSTKLLMAGHGVSLVCTRPTAELINREGTVVRFPIRGRQSPVDISSKKLPGALRATTPDEVDPREFQLIVLGMHEAQYRTSKAAPLDADEPTKLLRTLEVDIEEARFDPGDGPIEIPVKLKVHDSIFVPLAKWPMLMAGNYRSIRRDIIIPIKDAVHDNLDKSRQVYDWVWKLCTRLGASDADMVPFEKYAHAAEGLSKPSSAARALFGGAEYIERVDCLVRRIAIQQGLQLDTLDDIVALVDERLKKNRENSGPDG